LFIYLTFGPTVVRVPASWSVKTVYILLLLGLSKYI